MLLSELIKTVEEIRKPPNGTYSGLVTIFCLFVVVCRSWALVPVLYRQIIGYYLTLQHLFQLAVEEDLNKIKEDGKKKFSEGSDKFYRDKSS